MNSEVTQLEKPTPEQIKQARMNVGMTQKDACEVMEIDKYQQWQRWELGGASMPSHAWELFLLKTDQHPVYRLSKKRK